MTIDIQPGDTFQIDESFRLIQLRKEVYNWRWRFPAGEFEWGFITLDPKRTITAEFARQIITAAGHTIQETTPPPAPVPWPTHAVVDVNRDLILLLGSKEACEKAVRSGGIENHEVRPLAPAPPSSAMRSFIEAFEVYSNRVMRHTDTPGSIENLLLTACRNLLAEGGAQ